MNDIDVEGLEEVSVEDSVDLTTLNTDPGWDIEAGEATVDEAAKTATASFTATHRGDRRYEFTFDVGLSAETGAWQVNVGDALAAFDKARAGCREEMLKRLFKDAAKALNDANFEGLQSMAHPETRYDSSPMYMFEGWSIGISSTAPEYAEEGKVASCNGVASHRLNKDYQFEFPIIAASPNEAWQLLFVQTANSFEQGKDEWKQRMANQPGPRDGIPSRPYKLGETVKDLLEFEDNIFASLANRELGLVGPTGEEAFYDVYTFEAKAGQQVTFVLRGDGLDVFLAIAKADVTYMMARHIAEQLEDSPPAGDGWAHDDINLDEEIYDSCIHVTFPADGTYHIYCTQYERGAFGGYVLTSHEGAPTEEEKPVTD